jgi:hypothetical protein
LNALIRLILRTKADEHLFHDIKRMEVAFLDQNRRELEITRRLSLRQLDPLALARLREEGQCEFELPEAVFDLDFPGTISGASGASASPCHASLARTPASAAR